MTVHNNQIVNAVSVLSERSGKNCVKKTCGGCRNCVGLKGAIYEYIKRKIHKRLLGKVSLYITPSLFMKNLIEEAGFYPVEHIPNGFSLFKYSKMVNYNRILYVGRLSKEKGVNYLIKAMPNVLSVHKDAKLVIVGDGPEKDSLLELTKKLSLNNNISFRSSSTRKDIETFYRNSTILIVPSVYDDNFPTVVIEAMGIGRPVIGSYRGGIPELIENKVTGTFLRDVTSSEISKVIVSLLGSRATINKYSKHANIKSKNFSLDINAKSIEKIYERLREKDV